MDVMASELVLAHCGWADGIAATGRAPGRSMTTESSSANVLAVMARSTRASCSSLSSRPSVYALVTSSTARSRSAVDARICARVMSADPYPGPTVIAASRRTSAPRIDRAAGHITVSGGPSRRQAFITVRGPAGWPDTVPGVATARVVSVNTGHGRDAEWAGRLGRTAIDKRPVPGPVTAGRLGLAGDEQVDKPGHGGYEQALYAYA